MASLQASPKVEERAITSGTQKGTLGAFPFLPFLSQTAVTSGRLSRQKHSVTRGDLKKERRWKSYSTAGRSS